MRQVFEHTLRIGRYWAGDKVIELANPETGKFEAQRSDDSMWGRIILRSASSEGGLESATGKAAILDEVGQDEWKLEDWEAILRRLSLSQGRICGATTLYNLGWLKSEIYDRWVEGDPDIDIIQFASTLNPAFPQSEFDRAKRTTQYWRFNMFYRGLFAVPAGLIYQGFGPEMLVDEFSIPDDWYRIVGVDFGGANTATVHLAENPDNGIWYAYRETLEGGLPTSQHVERQTENIGNAADYEVVGGAKGESQQRDDWTDNGLYVECPIITDVESQIDKVTELISSNKFRVFRTLIGLRDEFGSYQRKTDASGNPTDEIQDKRKYHRLDALRYAGTKMVDSNEVYVSTVRMPA